MARLLCLTGPESSGKSTLAAALAVALNAPVLPELARAWLSTAPPTGAPPAVVDGSWLRHLATAHQAAETEALAQANSDWIVVDTDVLVIALWWQERFAAADAPWPDWLARALGERTQRCYVLCQPDIPWEPDPLRQNPTDRDRLYQRHQDLLESASFPWLSVHGTVTERLGMVTRWLASSQRCGGTDEATHQPSE